nr:MAG TPA: hypothetical protein [Caudoviricetes sp.]
MSVHVCTIGIFAKACELNNSSNYGRIYHGTHLFIIYNSIITALLYYARPRHRK